MRASVRAAFPAFTARFEGRLNFMYLDALGLVTTGLGNLIDPMPAAQTLPWEHADGSPASEDEIANEWATVKSRIDLAPRGGACFVDVTSLRLGSDGLDSLLWGKLTEDENAMIAEYPAWDSWPADAQLGALSMAWAMGGGFPSMFPSFSAACRNGDFAGAAAQCQMRASPGIAPRNAANFSLFTNAADVALMKLNPETLWYPAAPTPGAAGGAGAWKAIASIAAVAGAGYAAWRIYGASKGTAT